MIDKYDKIESYLKYVYGTETTKEVFPRVKALIDKYSLNTELKERWSEKDAILITYGDSILGEKNPLEELNIFLSKYLKNKISCVHILPFFPYSSDDGFSVIDYREVNPDVGNWENVEKLGEDFTLMFDLVVNHISQHSEWFKKYLEGDEKYKDYFIEESPKTDLSIVTRPRSTPLLTKYKQGKKDKHIWTTFSDDQIDLNFKNPDLLVEMLDILMMYANRGARIIRLDAIAFLWKRIGTSCLHLDETHVIVKMMREILECVNPNAIVLTETNVPNKENLSYFGNNDEAHMVYQFSLPPLLLHSLYSGNSFFLTKWAMSLPELPDDNTFFNFTASHDGIGVRPLEGLLPEKEVDKLLRGMINNGGNISYKSNTDGSKSPYEINISLFDAYLSTANGEKKMRIDRFLCSQSVMLAMRGIPAIYVHSLLATPNYNEGVKETGRFRTINRKQLDISDVETSIANPETETATVFFALMGLLELRQKQPAFHPNSKQEIIDICDNFFCVKRIAKEQTIFALSNVTEISQGMTPEKATLTERNLMNLFDGAIYTPDERIELKPYETAWLVETDMVPLTGCNG